MTSRADRQLQTTTRGPPGGRRSRGARRRRRVTRSRDETPERVAARGRRGAHRPCARQAGADRATRTRSRVWWSRHQRRAYRVAQEPRAHRRGRPGPRSGGLPARLQEPRAIRLRPRLHHVALPDRDQPLHRLPAQAPLLLFGLPGDRRGRRPDGAGGREPGRAERSRRGDGDRGRGGRGARNPGALTSSPCSPCASWRGCPARRSRRSWARPT